MQREAPEGEPAGPDRRPAAPATVSSLIVIIAARNEGDLLPATLHSVKAAFPEAELIVADDASTDATRYAALEGGAEVVSRDEAIGKGGNVTAAAAGVVGRADASIFLLCDGDLGASAGELRPLVDAVAEGDCDLAIAMFRNRVGGGFGVALRYAQRAIERLSGYTAVAPISGQRALSPTAMRAAYPFAAGYGMEIGITVDVVRAGLEVREIELDLFHRPTGRSIGGFLHRFRQLRDFRRVVRAKRG